LPYDLLRFSPVIAASVPHLPKGSVVGTAPPPFFSQQPRPPGPAATGAAVKGCRGVLRMLGVVRGCWDARAVLGAPPPPAVEALACSHASPSWQGEIRLPYGATGPLCGLPPLWDTCTGTDRWTWGSSDGRQNVPGGPPKTKHSRPTPPILHFHSKNHPHQTSGRGSTRPCQVPPIWLGMGYSSPRAVYPPHGNWWKRLPSHRQWLQTPYKRGPESGGPTWLGTLTRCTEVRVGTGILPGFGEAPGGASSRPSRGGT